MKILVTGGGGFIGGALVNRLVAKGYRVASFSRNDYPQLREKGVEVIRGNLEDWERVSKACAGVETIFHVAAKAGSWGDFHEYYRTNVLGTKNLIRSCRVNQVNKLIYTSSASVVFDGRSIEGGNESLPYPARHLSHYTATKAQAEQCVLEANSPTLKTLSLRPHLVWGPGDNHLIPKVLERAVAEKLRQIGIEDHLVDTTFIDNAVAAHLCAKNAIEKDPKVAGKSYFISNGKPCFLWEFINRVLKSAGISPVDKKMTVNTALRTARIVEWIYKTFPIRSEPPLTRFLIKELSTAHWFDISAACNLLGYKPEISTEEGLAKLAAWIQELINQNSSTFKAQKNKNSKNPP